MRTLMLVSTMLVLGLIQQLCAFSGMGAAITDAKIMENLIPVMQNEAQSDKQRLGGVLFDVWEKQGTEEWARGVYYYDFIQDDVLPVLPEGYALQDVSENQAWMLANEGANLWLISLENGNPTLVDDAFCAADEGISALFVSEDSFVYLQRESTNVILLQRDLTLIQEERWMDESMLPSQLLDGGDNGVWVRLRACEQRLNCTANEKIILLKDGVLQKIIVEAERFWPAKGSDRIVYDNPTVNTDLLYFADTLGFANEQLRMAGSYTLDADWGSNGDQLAVLRLKRDFNSHEVIGIGQYVIDARTLSVSEYSSLNGVLGQVLWRDDESWITVFTQEKSGLYQLAMAVTHLQDGSVDQIVFQPMIQSDNIIFVRQIMGIEE